MSTDDQIKKEALSVIDDETNRKIDDIKRHIDFICTSLRASANMQTNQLLVAIQQLTVEEFCLQYCGNTQVFLNEQNKKRMNHDSFGKFRKRKSAPETNTESTLKKTKPTQEGEEGRKSPLESLLKKTNPVKEKEATNKIEETTQKESGEEKKKEKLESVPEKEQRQPEYNIIEPLNAQLKRDGHPCIHIQLEPGKDIEELGHFDIETLNKEAISKLSDTQKARLYRQIEDIQDKLENLKHNFK